MLHSVILSIQWLSSDQGGRKNPPVGERYSTVARFLDVEHGSSIDWSVIIELNTHIIDLGHQLGRVSFLSEEAPQDLLKPGREFELLEGNRVVGRCKILDD